MVNEQEILTKFHYYFWNFETEEPIEPWAIRIDDQGRVHIEDKDIQAKKRFPDGRLPVQFGEIGGDFLAEDVGLTTLEGAPTRVYGKFSCCYNQLTSLLHAPESCVVFECSGNSLTSLQHISHVSNTIRCDNNQLSDLSSVPAVRYLEVQHNPIKNFRQIAPHMGRIYVTYDAHVPLLGLLAATEIRVLNDYEYMTDLEAILNKYCAGEGGGDKASMLKCAAELIRAGYKENARW